MNSKDYVASIPDFPREGVLFRDIMPLMAGRKMFKRTCDKVIDFIRPMEADVIAGPRSRGFIFGRPIAYELGIGFVPVHKPGKLPGETVGIPYNLEYGSSELHVYGDDIKKGQRVLIVDDLLATGDTVDATTQIIQGLGGEVADRAFPVELVGLRGREYLEDFNVLSLMSYE